MAQASLVTPAQLSFLTIYSPALGPTDETFKDQIVFYWSRPDNASHRKQRKPAPASASTSTTAAGSDGHDGSRQSGLEQKENDKLRRIGLAQGMVDFAKTFSNGTNVDSIETETSRIILRELEPGWWILASIDLTRLPATNKGSSGISDTSKPSMEYSAREISPAPLLVQQLVQAHAVFLLHHAVHLSAMLERCGRSTFTALVERYWNRFAREWDVLLHGNPAATIYGCTKLAGGGELGMGVGEEEWGSGEREVLEGFLARTEGLADLLVGRYGNAPPPKKPGVDENGQPKIGKQPETAWLGRGEDAAAADGLVFTGHGNISKRTLSTISYWMQDVYKSGENAYGVGENPSSRPRQRRRRPKDTSKTSGSANSTDPLEIEAEGEEVHPRQRPSKNRAPDLRRKALENSATPPGIPAPLVSQVERSLDEALIRAAKPVSQAKEASNADEESSLLSSDGMMKILTLGYGSSWSLGPRGSTKSTAGPESSTKQDDTSTKTEQEEPSMQEVDPTPEVSDEEGPAFVQELAPSDGKFLIGLSGDLEDTGFDTDLEEESGAEDPSTSSRPRRIFLRTLTVEMSNPMRRRRWTDNQRLSQESLRSVGSVQGTRPGPKTSAAASVDGARPNHTYEKLQVAVYVHQPFIFVFLFALHTPNLLMPAFYRGIHHQLGPLQQPLLRSTDPTRVADRIADALGETSSRSGKAKQMADTIYDLVYNPAQMTVRTSIPNIPFPAGAALRAVGSGSPSLTVSGSWYTLGIPIGNASDKVLSRTETGSAATWSRIDALQVHTHVLNVWSATRHNTESERTLKTGRSWWLLWLKTRSNSSDKREDTKVGGQKEAILVRKAIGTTSDNARSTSHAAGLRQASNSGPGRWLLREQFRDTSNSSTGSFGDIGAGSIDGGGVDARKWVEGLLHLMQ